MPTNRAADRRAGQSRPAQQWHIEAGEAATASANNTTIQNLPRGQVINHILFRLQGTLTNVEATDDIATTGRGDFWALISEMRIKRGGDVIYQVDGPAIPWLQFFQTGIMPRERTRELGTGTNQASATAVTYDVFWIVPFYLAGSRYPRIAALDGRVRMPSLQVEVDWAAASAVDATATAIATGTLTPFCVSYVNPERGVGEYWLPQIRRRTETISAANTALRLQLDGSHWMSSLLIGALSDTVEVATILNNVTWRSGGRTMFDNIPAPVLREHMHQWLRLDREHFKQATTAGANTVDTAEEFRYSGGSLVSPDSNFEGWHYITPMLDGDPRDLFPAGGVPEHVLQLNVSAPGTTNQLLMYPTHIRQGQSDV